MMSPKDNVTLDTATQIYRHNEKGARLCNWQPLSQ